MNFHDVNLLIEGGEGFTLEFKRRISSPEKIARTIISFANTKGGTILFGVDDDGSIVGVESEKSEVELVEMAGRDFCDPPIQPAVHNSPRTMSCSRARTGFKTDCRDQRQVQSLWNASERHDRWDSPRSKH